ncbi:MAG: hypothetical protein JWL96_1192 [Sphingomonas bacterium]|uniref:hypothetical protein n=1 Tax=Sphingomonas bacterium TaxID=1895847 RepID=UPI002604C2F5|nr:hypothetical protein [Sphingomonas bacterium]MDB5709122.1 hypothetical protein [Sphingomonas bacterium]
MKRQVPAEMVEQWMTHLRLQRTRARDMIWLIEQGATFHDGREGEPTRDATARWLSEQQAVIADVDRLVGLYDSING